MKVVALVQSRMGSTRLPNKVMKPINGVPMIELLLSRLSNSRRIDEIVLATSVDRRNGPLVEHVRGLGYACEEGSEDDVLERYVQAAKAHDADVVVRITGIAPWWIRFWLTNASMLFSSPVPTIAATQTHRPILTGSMFQW